MKYNIPIAKSYYSKLIDESTSNTGRMSPMDASPMSRDSI